MGKNIIWIVLDSIRADRTPFVGSERQTMPELRSLEGAVGTTCITHGIWSQPSMASMMTGTWPSHHGAGLHNEVLPDEIETVAERLTAAGYHTIGLSTNPYFSPDTGLDRGFSEFAYMSPSALLRSAGASGLASFVWNVRRFSAGLTLEKRKHSHDFLFNEVVKDRLEDVDDSPDPFALVAHYHGAHHPYFPSPVFQSRFAEASPVDPAEAADRAYHMTEDAYASIASGESRSDTEWEILRSMYDSLLSQIDGLVRRLLDHISHLGLDDESIIVITADHGDLLGEYDLVSHKLLLHEALLEVPLVVAGSETVQAVASSENAQHADVMRATLEAVGADTTDMHGTTAPNDRGYTITQRGKETAEKTLSHVRQHDEAFDHRRTLDGLLTAIRSPDGYKLISSPDTTRLYEHERPATEHRVADDERERELAETLSEWTTDYGQQVQTSDEAAFSSDVKDRLGDLGYVVE